MLLTHNKSSVYVCEMSRKLLFLCFIALLAVCIYSAVHFFIYGVSNNVDLTKNYIDEANPAGQTSDPACVAKWQTAEVQMAPLQAKANAIATYIANAPMPISNGQTLLNQYQQLEAQATKIEINAQC